MLVKTVINTHAWLANAVHSDMHKTFVDDESYNSGHGHAYEKYGVDVVEGAIAIVRPDQCSLPDIKIFESSS